MDDILEKIIKRILNNKGEISNEQQTKQSLIIPFIRHLKYDTEDIKEVKLEESADITGERSVDYTIYNTVSQKKAIIIESKKLNIKDLNTYWSQLADYYKSLTPNIILGILTNGKVYKFYKDLDDKNIMDKFPFYEFDIVNISNRDIEFLKYLEKDNLMSDYGYKELEKFAKEVKLYSKVRDKLLEEIKNPSKEFTKHFNSTILRRGKSQKNLEIIESLIKRAGKEILKNISDSKEVYLANYNARNFKAKKLSYEIEEQKTINYQSIFDIKDVTGKKALRVIYFNKEEKKFKNITDFYTESMRVLYAENPNIFESLKNDSLKKKKIPYHLTFKFNSEDIRSPFKIGKQTYGTTCLNSNQKFEGIKSMLKKVFPIDYHSSIKIKFE